MIFCRCYKTDFSSAKCVLAWTLPLFAYITVQSDGGGAYSGLHRVKVVQARVQIRLVRSPRGSPGIEKRVLRRAIAAQ